MNFAPVELRFVERDGKRILQSRWMEFVRQDNEGTPHAVDVYDYGAWMDVPLVTEHPHAH